METMLKVMCRLDQGAAAVAGFVVPPFGETELDLTRLTEEERRYAWNHRGDLYQGRMDGSEVKRPIELTEKTAVDLIRAVLAEKAEREREHIKAQEEEHAKAAEELRQFVEAVEKAQTLADIPSQYVDAIGCDHRFVIHCPPIPTGNERAQAACNWAEELVNLRNREIQAERETKRRLEEKYDQDLKDAKQQVRDSWVAEHGTDEQKARHARGMLPEDEILAGLRDQLFAPAKDMPRFKRLTNHHVQCPDCGGGRVEFTSGSETKATAEQFAKLLELETLFPQPATVALRWHNGRCSCQGGVLHSRWSFSVHIPIRVGDLLAYELGREFAAPGQKK